MARPLRIEYPGAVYHITNRGNAQNKIFFNDADKNYFMLLLSDVVERYKWICHAYCLMENHYHLLIETPLSNISRGMRQLNGVYSQFINNKYDRSGHIFQGRFKGILVQRDSHLLELARYIVLNPVRAGICVKPDLYRWSSYNAMIGKTKKANCLNCDWILSQFSNNSKSAILEYRKFVNDKIIENPMNKLIGQIYFGTKEFVKSFSKTNDIINDIPRVHQQPIRPPLEELLKKNNGILLAYKTYGYTIKSIADCLDIHYTTAGRHIKKILKDQNA